MSKLLGLALVVLSLSASAAQPAADAKPAATKPAATKAAQTKPSEARLAQQARMKSCNGDAKTKGLKGDERKAFMGDCLRKKA